MSGWAILGGLLALLWALDALRIRTRSRALHVLAPSDDPVHGGHVFVVRPGVTLDEATRRAASAYARAEGLSVLDLVSPRIASWRAVVLLLAVDPARYRRDRVAGGVSAGDAILVDASVLARAKEGAKVSLAPGDAVGFIELARVLKRYAITESDLAIAPALESPGVPLIERRRILRIWFGDLVGQVVVVQLVLIALAIALEPIAGLVALAISHLQVFVGTLGTPLAPKDRFSYILVRTFVDALSALGPVSTSTAFAEASPTALRATYEALLANGTAPFFDPPRDDCPLCGDCAVKRVFEVNDRHQHKPGRFSIARCDACGHLFQNPRLSLEGLSFYYKDFYDGLGEEPLEAVFASSPHLYLARAKMVAAVAKPKRWLDVGAGHGHFCNVAKDVLPDTTFDGLDLADSIEDAERRRWVERGIRGLFPEVAPKLADEGTRYDVVSMSHYLEHTLDPRAEIAAAARLLDEGGLFFIEVPDPECRFGRLLGKRWMPWFQPQHLNFLSVKNLERLLREQGFEPLVWHRGEAHQPCDLTFFTYIEIERLAPLAERPWQPVRGPGARVWRRVVWTAAVPLLGAAWVVDHLFSPIARRAGWSNTYRVLARRTAGKEALAIDPSHALKSPPVARTHVT